MFTSNISLAVLLSVALLLGEKKLQVEANECYSNSDCGLSQYCCKQRYSWQTNVCGWGSCVGQSCRSKNDCGGTDECCSSSRNICTRSDCHECYSNSDCGYNRYCCRHRHFLKNHVCRSDGCVGQLCSSDSDCRGPGECCSSNVCTKSACTNLKTVTAAYGCSTNSDCPGFYNYCCRTSYNHERNVCSSNCVNKSCNWYSDCGGPSECCRSNTCTTSGCSVSSTSVIIISVVVSIFFIIVVPLAVVAWCRHWCGLNSASPTSYQRRRVGVWQETVPTIIALQNNQTVQTNPIQFESPPPSAPPAYCI